MQNNCFHIWWAHTLNFLELRVGLGQMVKGDHAVQRQMLFSTIALWCLVDYFLS